MDGIKAYGLFVIRTALFPLLWFWAVSIPWQFVGYSAERKREDCFLYFYRTLYSLNSFNFFNYNFDPVSAQKSLQTDSIYIYS